MIVVVQMEELKRYILAAMDNLRKLSPSEKKLMLAFLENKAILARQILAVSQSYGLSGLETIKSLISLVKKDLVFPRFFFPSDIDKLFIMTPFPNKFLSFDEIVDLSRIPRNLREKLLVVLNDLRRTWNSTIADLGIFGGYSQVALRSPWRIIGKYYQSAKREGIIEYITKLIEQRVPGEEETSYHRRFLPHALLGLWTAFFASKIRKEDIVSDVYPAIMIRVEKRIEALSPTRLGNVINHIEGILSFIATSINELFLVGIEISRTEASSILNSTKNIGESLKTRGLLSENIKNLLARIEEALKIYL